MAENGLLVLVRHGQSRWNLENRFTGWADVPLTETGAAEARRAGALLQGYGFDRAFTSTLSRARDTLRIILHVLREDMPVVESAALNERHYGALQGLNKDETARLYGEEQVRQWRRSYRAAPPGGESLQDTAKRVLPFYEEAIEPLVLAGQRILVVAHGNSLRALIMHLEQIPEAEIPDLYVPWGVPLRYVIGSGGQVVERGYLGVEP